MDFIIVSLLFINIFVSLFFYCRLNKNILNEYEGICDELERMNISLSDIDIKMKPAVVEEKPRTRSEKIVSDIDTDEHSKKKRNRRKNKSH